MSVISGYETVYWTQVECHKIFVQQILLEELFG